MTAADTDGLGQGAGARDAPRVFVSHASADADAARRLVTALELHGIHCWIAPRDVAAGAQYADAIVRAIAESPVFVVLLSAQAIASAHVGREVERAGSKGRRILALRLDSAPLTPALEYFLGESQWVDLQGGEAAAQGRLMQAILQSSASSSAAATPVPAARPAHPKRLQVALIAAAVLVVAGALAWKFLPLPGAQSQSATPAAESIGIEKSIAVLPFTDMSERKDQEYFADGMAEEILDLLGKVPGLKVIGRTSSFQFKGKTDDLRKIGALLGARYVVEGSVRRSGADLRVTAELIDTRDGARRWSETYERHVSDVLQIQNDIALGLTRALQIELTGWDSSRPPPKSLEAYDSFLRALHARERYDRAGMEEAIADLKHALALDPQLVSAAEQLAVTYWDMAAWGFILPGPGYREARATAERALALSPNSAIAHAVLCELYTRYEWDWAAATRECTAAQQISPHSSYVLLKSADLQLALANWDSASELIEGARAADPLDPEALETAGSIYIRAGRKSDAEKAFRHLVSVAPTYVYGHCLLAIALVDSGHAEEALVEGNKETETMERALCSAVGNHALKRPQPRDRALAELEVAARALWPMSVAEAHAFAGNKDRAFEWLQRAYDEKDSTLYWIKGDPLLRNLESDPRYGVFLQKLNFPK